MALYYMTQQLNATLEVTKVRLGREYYNVQLRVTMSGFGTAKGPRDIYAEIQQAENEDNHDNESDSENGHGLNQQNKDAVHVGVASQEAVQEENSVEGDEGTIDFLQ